MPPLAPDPIAILKKRQLPGVVLLDGTARVLWRNRQADTLMRVGGGAEREGQVLSMSDAVVALAQRRLHVVEEDAEAAMAVVTDGDVIHGLRADLLAAGDAWSAVPASESGAPMVMVWIDTVSLSREVDFDAVRRRYGISRREQDVLRMLYHGKGNREIAALLFISEHTVKDHLKAILAKMDVTSRAQVVYKLTTA